MHKIQHDSTGFTELMCGFCVYPTNVDLLTFGPTCLCGSVVHVYV